MASGGSWKLFDNCLTEAVRKKPVLYNKKLKEFKQINVKDNAWSEVAKEVGANGNSIHIQIRQEGQLSQTDRATLPVVKYCTVTQGQSK